MSPGIRLRLPEAVEVSVHQHPVPASLVGPALRRIQQPIQPKQQRKLALDRGPPLEAACTHQATRQGFLGVLAGGVLAMGQKPPVPRLLPGREAGGIDIEPEMPHQVCGPRRQSAGLPCTGRTGVEELDQGVGGQLPAFGAGAPCGVLRGRVIEPCGPDAVEHRRERRGWWRLALSRKPA